MYLELKKRQVREGLEPLEGDRAQQSEVDLSHLEAMPDWVVTPPVCINPNQHYFLMRTCVFMVKCSTQI
jgi:hypothetical protein